MASKPRPSPDGTKKELSVLDARIPLFVAEYVANGGNGTQAAITAGCPEKGAHVQSNRWLKNARVVREIEKSLRAKVQRISERGDKVIGELFRILNVNVKDVFTPDGAMKPINELSDDLGRAISSIEVEEIFASKRDGGEQIGVIKKIKFWSKTESANLLGKHLKLWADAVGVNLDLFVDGANVEMVLEIKT